ncbi:TPA: hypothetical protein JBH76_08060 [Legionella pneumophila]|nr:hypothetical protein [Legionella pneumophila]HAT8335899.1 hypothetical protein [Legionella pneumophila]HAU0970143.1 hypothetical protein [Legionella pneumophila]HAU1556151.1 hypothetical protein [Legionella pneumophila]HAU1645541.1 hypothetical protein [Legionella pneumophila]
MDVIINTESSCDSKEGKLLKSQGLAVLNLLACGGYDLVNPPVGNLLKSSHNLEGDWVVLTPMHWQASHNDAVIVALDKDLRVTDEEVKYWFDLYSAYLAEEGMPLYFYDKYTWLLRVDDKPPLNAKPIYQVLNKSLMPELSQLDETMYWQKFFTESQMFFSSNARKSLINGVWAWGSGKLKTKKTISICTDKHFLAVAQAYSSNVTLYDPSVNVSGFDVVLLHGIDSLSELHQVEIKKIPAHWYWNNCVLIKAKSHWFTRLWRSLTHAD